jgi:NADP-dependent 3-hydroxy acid dehydrogenase YdfG
MKNHYFQNKVVIITGASSGIGASCVKQLAGLGAKVVMVARRQMIMRQIQQELGAKDSLIVQADIRHKKDVELMVERVVSKYGRIDILINNAGVGFARFGCYHRFRVLPDNT